MRKLARSSTYGIATAITAALLGALGTPAAAEFVLNDNSSVASVGDLSVSGCSDASGNYVVVWDARSGSSSSDISLRRFSSEGVALGPQFTPLTSSGGHARPFVACQPDGSFLVVWHELGFADGDGDLSAVMGRFYDATGAPIGAPFVVNDVTTGHQEPHGLCAVSGGAYLAVWEGAGQYLARRWTTGGPGSAEVVVGPVGGLHADQQLVCSGDDALLTWGTTLNALHGQRLDATPAVVGAPFTFDTPPSSDVDDVAMAPGVVVATWRDVGGFARRYDLAGAPLAPAFQFAPPWDTFYAGDQDVAPPVVTSDGGFFFALLAKYAAPGKDAVLGRAFDGAQGPVGDRFFINERARKDEKLETAIPGANGDALVVLRYKFYLRGRIFNPTPPVCSPVPLPGCYQGERSTLVVNDPSSFERDRLNWKSMKVAGAPAERHALRGLALCLYDRTGGVPSLVRQLDGPLTQGCQGGGKACWKTLASGGVKYTDPRTTFDATTQILVDGKKAQYAGKGLLLLLPGPVSGSAYFDADPSVTAQLVGPTGECWSADYPVALKNSPVIYRALAVP